MHSTVFADANDISATIINMINISFTDNYDGNISIYIIDDKDNNDDEDIIINLYQINKKRRKLFTDKDIKKIRKILTSSSLPFSSTLGKYYCIRNH